MPAKITEEERQAREQVRLAKKEANKAERDRKKASTTVEKMRQYEADYREQEQKAKEERKKLATLAQQRYDEVADMNLSAEERRNKEIDRMHDFYDVVPAPNSMDITIKINNYKLINMLRNMGFYRYDQEGGAFEYVKIKDNKITLLRNEGQEIIDSFEDYVRQLPECEKTLTVSRGDMKVVLPKQIYPNMIMEKLYNNLGQYFSQTLPRLRPIPGCQVEEISTVHDTKDSKYLFFRNVVLRISKNGTDEISYSNLSKYIDKLGEDNGKYIWESSIIDRDFHKGNGCGMFSMFTKCICGINSYPDELVQSRERCLKSILGYLIHDDYDCNLKAVLFTDAIIDQGAPSGGTGKGLIGKALGNIINKNYGVDTKYIAVPGKGFDCSKDTRYSNGDITTQLIHIEDTDRNFDFEKLYNDVTDGAVFRKLHHDPTYHKTKIMISTNAPFDITAPSTKRRILIFELHNYFNQFMTPEDVLGGRMFESSWSEDQWSAFDNYMVECCEEYMRNGVIDQGEVNYSDNYLKSVLRQEFKSWFEEYIKSGYVGHKVAMYDLKKMWTDFSKRYPDVFAYSNSFNMAIKKWLRVKAVPSGIVRSTSDMLYLYPAVDTHSIDWIYRWSNKA